MKKSIEKYSPAITLIAGIVAGVLLIFKPETMLGLVIKIIGWGLIIAGALIAGEKLLSGKKVLSDYTHSIIMVLGGIAVLVLAGTILNIIPKLIGIVLFVSGAYKLLSAFKMRKSGDKKWIYMAVMAALSIVFGIFVFCQPAKVAKTALRIVGVILLIECAEDLFAIKIFK